MPLGHYLSSISNPMNRAIATIVDSHPDACYRRTQMNSVIYKGRTFQLYHPAYTPIASTSSATAQNTTNSKVINDGSS